MKGDAMSQNPDGSWSEAVPLGWQGNAIDFEVYESDEDMLVAVVTAKTRAGLNRKMAKAAKRLDMSWTVL